MLPHLPYSSRSFIFSLMTDIIITQQEHLPVWSNSDWFSLRCKSVWTLWEDACRGGRQAVSEAKRGAGKGKGGAQKHTDFPPQGEEGGEGGDEE